MKDVALLQSLQEAAMAAPEFQPNQPQPGMTHCNAALRRIAKGFGYDFPDCMANDMIEIMFKDKRWSKVASFMDGNSHALGGGLTVLAKKFDVHGHVCTVMTGPMKVSPTLNEYVPVVANIGKENAPMLASRAFPVLINGKVDIDWLPYTFCLDFP